MSASITASARRTSRHRRHLRVRKKVEGSALRPRLVVFRSARHIYGQVVDDTTGRVLAAASTLDSTLKETAGDKKTRAKEVGRLLARRAKESGLTAVVFDRAGYRYHGRVAALADGAREEGLSF